MSATKEKEREPSSIEIGGRKFLEIREGTLEHDLHFGALAARAGVDDVVRGSDEGPEDFARRLLEAVLAGEVILELLAALMVPEDLIGEGQEAGDVWTLDVARDTREFLAGLRAAEDKFRVRSLVVQLLLVFFERGIVSLWTSPPSLKGGPDVSEKQMIDELIRTHRGPTAAPAGGPGQGSSESSPEEITTEPGGSSAGPSERP